MKKSTDLNFYQLWEESQKHLWKSLSTIANPFEFPKKLGFLQSPNFQILSAWGEAAINQSLEMQTAWLDRWVQRMKEEATDPDLFDDLIGQISDSMNQWTKTQQGLWGNWFRMLEVSAALPGISDHQKTILDSWKQTVDQSLSEQTRWLSLWSDRIAYKQLKGKELDDFTQQLKEAMAGWIHNQQQLWQYWFEYLNAKEAFSLANPSPQLKNNTIVYKAVFKDDLKLISGIGPRFEDQLNQRGIVTFQQIADLTDDEIDHLENSIRGFPGRIKRDNWRDQAKKFCDKPRK